MQDIPKGAKTARTLGIIGIILAVVGFLVPFGGIGGIVCDIIAIVMGVKYRNLARQAGDQQSYGVANMGMILGIVGIVVAVVVMIVAAAMVFVLVQNLSQGNAAQGF
jgi:uncharacterized membrane protein